MKTQEHNTSTNVLGRALVKELESTEASYWMHYYQSQEPLQTYVTHVSGALACAMPDLDVLAFNRVIGLGLQGTIQPGELEALIRFYKRAGAKRFFIQLPPQLVDELVACTLEEQGFIHHNNWSKLMRSVSPLHTSTNPELSIEVLTRDRADLFGQIIYECFDWEQPELLDLLSSVVGQKGYTHYLVRYQGHAIAVGALYVQGEMASMAFAGTLMTYRGLGAQSLLLKRRLIDAQLAGAKYITAETAQHTLERPVKSYVNMCKAGFGLAYQRQNWLYTF